MPVAVMEARTPNQKVEKFCLAKGCDGAVFSPITMPTASSTAPIKATINTFQTR